MADNVTADAGSGGAVFATDDVAGVHYPINKLAFGALDSVTLASGGSGVVDAGTQRVTIATDDTVTVDGTVTANLSATDNAVLDSIDAAVNGTLTVDGSAVTQPISGTVTANLGTIDNAVLDSIDAGVANVVTAVQLLDNAISGSEMQVDVVTSALPSGAATETTLDAIKTAVELIDNAISGSEMQVDVVSGTVTANLGATDNAVLDAIEANTSGSTSHYRNIDANAEDAIKSSAGTLKWLHAMNLTASKAYIHLYDATTASVTPGTTTPSFTFPLATQGDTNGAGFVLPAEIEFTTAITIVVTTTVDGSTGDPGTNGVIVNAGYV